MRVSTLLRSLAGLCRATVITGWFLDRSQDHPELVIEVRVRSDRARSCGRCGQRAKGYDQGGGVRRWRHVDLGFARCVLEGPAPRVTCGECGPTVADVPWARHDTVSFSASRALSTMNQTLWNQKPDPTLQWAGPPTRGAQSFQQTQSLAPHSSCGWR